MRSWRSMTACALAVVALTTAACSGGDGNNRVATINGSDDSSSSSDGGGGDNAGQFDDTEFRDAMLEHAQCMRDHGIDMPDPTFDGDGGSRMIIDSEDGIDFDSQQYKDAEAACRPIMEEARQNMPKPSAEEQAKMRDEMLAFAQCMREHGIDMPDPTFGEDGSVSIGVGGPPRGGDGDASDSATSDGSEVPADKAPRMDPEFEAAAEECAPEGGPFGRKMGSTDDSSDDE